VSRFFKSLGVVGAWFAIARFISAVAAVVAARLLGAEAYGDAQLAVTVAQAFCVLSIFGLNSAVVRYGAPARDPRPYTASSWWFVAAGSILWCLLLIPVRETLRPWFGTTSDMMLLGLCLGPPMALFVQVSAVQQTVGEYNRRGLAEAVLSMVFMVSLPLAFVFFGRSYLASIFAFLAAYLVATGLAVWWSRPWLSLQPVSKTALIEMAPYGWYNFLCGIGFFFTSSIQKPIIKHYLSSTEVGQYSLYTMASLNLAIYGGSVLATVFFPTAARSADRAGLWNVTWRAWGKVVWILFLALFVAQVAAVVLSGREEYPLDLGLAVLFAATSGVMMVQSSLGQIIGAEGVRGARLGVLMSLSVGFVNIGLSHLLIPRFHVHGAILALLIVYSLALLVLVLVRKRYL
jgi:O-antigen/teichoic acid export membrane protein